MHNSLRCKLRSDKLLFLLITQLPQALRITTTPANAPAINKFPVCYFAVELTLCCVTFLCYVTFLRRVMLLHCVTVSSPCSVSLLYNSFKSATSIFNYTLWGGICKGIKSDT